MKITRSSYLTVAILPAASPNARSAEPFFTQQDLLTSGIDNVNIDRIRALIVDHTTGEILLCCQEISGGMTTCSGTIGTGGA